MALEFAKKLIKVISLNKLLLWVFSLAFLMVSFTIYENRSKLIEQFVLPSKSNMVGTTFTIGKETEKVVKDIVTSEKSIAGIVIWVADIRLNEATPAYFHTDEYELDEFTKKLLSPNAATMPIFGASDKNNETFVKLINGDFSCVKFSETSTSTIYPELNSKVKEICRASIPSYYGYFSGFVTVMLTEETSPEQQHNIKLIANKLATEIYFRDVLPTQKQKSRKQAMQFLQ